MLQTAFFSALIAFLATTTVFAQENRSELSLQGTGLFTTATSGSAYTDRPAPTGGFLTANRYRLHRGLSAEFVYGAVQDLDSGVVHTFGKPGLHLPGNGFRLFPGPSPDRQFCIETDGTNHYWLQPIDGGEAKELPE
jgi:hypothetical protein